MWGGLVPCDVPGQLLAVTTRQSSGGRRLRPKAHQQQAHRKLPKEDHGTVTMKSVGDALENNTVRSDELE